MHRMQAIGILAAGAILTTGLVVARDVSLRDWVENEVQLVGRDPRAASMVVECTAEARPISPLIYGIGGIPEPWPLGITARRHGGNPTTRYNWELDTHNAGSDWFYKNSGGRAPGNGLDSFLSENLRHDVKSALTVPMLGWVAKDATSYAFPVSIFGPQKATAPEDPDAGNGLNRLGKPIAPGPPTITSVRSSAESIERWVRRIREKDAARGRSVESYILDNEPMLWNTTHRDVHPEPTTYDELLQKTVEYATAIRRADPEGKIAGPAEWGWLGYQYSAKDVAAGLLLRPDRRRHGDVPLIPWYLRKLREYEQRADMKMLDILDVHFYPMGDGIWGGETDAVTAAKRIRSTRSLWDPTYRDESWINDRMQVLPLLRQWVTENAPGLGISIGEWNFGASNHMSGGLATAEALGRFGMFGLTSAYLWGDPGTRTPAFYAFRAYRNFDNQGGHFQDWSIPVKVEGTLVSLFASRDEARRQIVAVLLNFAPYSALSTRVNLQGCGGVALARGFSYTGGTAGFANLAVSPGKDALEVTIAPYSINVLDVSTAPPPTEKTEK
jgi:Glycoside hydrolase family 44